MVIKWFQCIYIEHSNRRDKINCPIIAAKKKHSHSKRSSSNWVSLDSLELNGLCDSYNIMGLLCYNYVFLDLELSV
jgi:hypothetical protein